MNEGDIVILGRWLGEGYGEYLAVVTDDGWGSNPKIDVAYTCGDGEYTRVYNVEEVGRVSEGEDYFRVDTAVADPLPFNRQLPLIGKAVWVNYVSHDHAHAYRGIVISVPDAPVAEWPVMRVVFYDRRRRRRKVRTLLHGTSAIPCDNYWSDIEPAFHDCDIDDD